MNYLITKTQGDSRKGICGVIIPDGFFVVVQLTFENQQQLKNIMALPGDTYQVTKTDLPEGHYAPNGCRVTLASLWNWYPYQEALVFMDDVPAGSPDIPSPNKDIRPPELSERPEHIDLEDLGEGMVDVPEAVKLARKIVADQQARGIEGKAAPAVAHTVESEIPLQDDIESLQEAGATDEVAMLRAALDARGIKYHPTAKAPALKKKLEAA